jgi:TolA-binding protein
MTELRQKVGPAAQLSAAAMARIAARLEAEERRPRGQTPMALAGAAVVGALAVTMWLLARPPQALMVVGSQPAAEPAVPAVHTIVVPEAAPQPAVRHNRPPQPAQVPEAERAPQPMPETPPVIETPRAESSLAAESRLLAAAIAKLRKEPAAALAALDDYATRFPQGQLSAEAQVMRIDALLALGRRDGALRALDGMTLGGLPRGRELVLLRAELRSEAGRCRDALADFGTAIVEAADPFDERALYGRAVCRAKLGNIQGARSDLGRYLVRFPDGRFAADARHALER